MNSDVYDTSSTGVSSLKERKQARSNVFTNGLMSVKVCYFIKTVLTCVDRSIIFA